MTLFALKFLTGFFVTYGAISLFRDVRNYFKLRQAQKHLEAEIKDFILQTGDMAEDIADILREIDEGAGE